LLPDFALVSCEARDAEQIKTIIAFRHRFAVVAEAVLTVHAIALHHVALFVAPTLATDANVRAPLALKVKIIFHISI
jgi:hypothetical protein